MAEMRLKQVRLRFFLSLLIGLSAFVVPTFTTAATCQTIAQCQQQRNNLSQNLTQTRVQQDAARARARELQRIVNQITAQINDTQRQINRTQSQIDELQGQIDGLSAQIRQKQIELAIEQENQREAVRLLYETGGGGTIELLLGHDSLAEAATTSEYLDAIEQKVEETIVTIGELQKQLNLQKQDLEGKRGVLQELARTLQAQRAQLADQRALQQQALNDANASLADLNRQVNELNQQIRAVDGSISAFLRSSFANSSGNMVVINTGNHYYQWSNPWGPRFIDEDTMSESGCLITSIDMVSHMMGKNVGDPGDFLDALKRNGALWGDLVSWGSGVSAATGGLTWTRHYDVTWSTINGELAFGRPVIIQVGGFHWVVLTGYNAAAGTYSINDPYFSNRSYPQSAVTGYVTVR